MKNLIYILFLFVSLVNAQYTLIPDTNFEQDLINQNIDSEGTLDGQILTDDINTLESLNIDYEMIMR
jgi:hypothetical protein